VPSSQTSAASSPLIAARRRVVIRTPLDVAKPTARGSLMPGILPVRTSGSAARQLSTSGEASVDLILLTTARQPTTEVLPALGLLPHRVTVLPLDAGGLVDRPLGDAVLVDARRDLAAARGFTRVLAAVGLTVPVLAVLTEGGLIALSADWSIDDIILDTAGPAELEARLRLAIERRTAAGSPVAEHVAIGELTIDETTYTARLSGAALDLTYKEFELLKFLAQHPGRVFTRSHLVQEVWGYDYFGGTRTVDVHVRRLRAKLGPEHEALIGTVRNVGYKFVRPAGDPAPARRSVAEPALD
jgi:DNA-binding response OmpR family regulator